MNFLNEIFGGTPNYSEVKSPYQQVQALVPSLPTMTSTAAGNISSMLAGNLTPDVVNQIRNAGATWGVTSGMPGSGAAGNVTLESLGQTALSEQQTGMADYTNFLTGIGGQMMPVSTQMEMADAAAAPSPIATGLLSMLGMGAGGLLGAYLRPSQTSGSTPSTSDTSTSTNIGTLPASFDPGQPYNFDISGFTDLYGGGVGAGSGLGDIGIGAEDLGSLF